jgi:hypothetical protein
MPKKKKKEVITIKTSLNSVLLDHEDGEGFQGRVKELVKKLHLLRVGTQQFIHWYYLNVEDTEPINSEFLKALLTVFNGISSSSSTKGDFGAFVKHLIPLVDRFLSESNAQLLFPPSLAGRNHLAVMFVDQNPKPANWKGKRKYEDIVSLLVKGKSVTRPEGIQDFSGLKERVMQFKQSIDSLHSLHPAPIPKYYSVMFAYLATDIVQNIKEKTKRLLKKRLYSLVWNQITGGIDIPKDQLQVLNNRKLTIINNLYKGGKLSEQDQSVVERLELKLNIDAGDLDPVATGIKLAKYNQVSSLVWKELAAGVKVVFV